MKAINPQAKGHKKADEDRRWLTLFETLDHLVKAQLIICPKSYFHFEESIVSPFPEPVREISNLLSYGTEFKDPQAIRRLQLYQKAEQWLEGDSNRTINLDRSLVLQGRINDWQGRFILTVSHSISENEIEQIRQYRNQGAQGLIKVFIKWQNGKKSFDEIFEEEARAFGRTHVEFHRHQLMAIASNPSATVSMLLNTPESVLIFICLSHLWEKYKIPKSEHYQRSVDFLLSDRILEIPCIRIASLLYAALARKAAGGMKRFPNKGMYNDIEVLSCYSPYCDAFLVDNECYSLLQEHPQRERIPSSTYVYNMRHLDDFLSMLEDVKHAADRTHWEKIQEVYGDGWLVPFTELFNRK